MYLQYLFYIVAIHTTSEKHTLAHAHIQRSFVKVNIKAKKKR